MHTTILVYISIYVIKTNARISRATKLLIGDHIDRWTCLRAIHPVFKLQLQNYDLYSIRCLYLRNFYFILTLLSNREAIINDEIDMSITISSFPVMPYNYYYIWSARNVLLVYSKTASAFLVQNKLSLTQNPASGH